MRLALPSPTSNEASIRPLADVISRAFGLITAALSRVPRSQYVDVTSPASADTPFVVGHSLGVIPAFFVAQSASDARCYASTDDKREWTANLIKIRCTAANAPLRVKVEAE